MNSARLDSLSTNGVAFDLETHLVQPGLPAVPVVCGSAARGDGKCIQDPQNAEHTFREILESPRLTLIGANIAFDVLCMARRANLRGEDLMPAILAMYDPGRTAAVGQVDGRVICVQIWEQLHAVARGHLGGDPWTGKRITDPSTGRPGRYSLREVVKQVLGRDNAKANDRFRMSYALLENIPIEQWPLEARTYPVDDAVNTLEAALAQAGHLPSCAPHVWSPASPTCKRCNATPGGDPLCRARERRQNSHELARQTYVQLCGALGGAWGFHIDQQAVDAIEAKYHETHAGQEQPFIDAGIIRSKGAKAGTVDESKLKRLTAAAYGATQPCPHCTGGKVPSPATNGKTKINCKQCDGSGLLLTSVPRTPSGEIGIGRDVLTESGDEFLRSFAVYDEGKKIPNTYVPFFRTARPPVAGHVEGCPSQREGRKGACTCPGPYYETPLNLRFNTLLETGRTSYDGVIQLMPREGGVRECIVARPGYVFSSEDYKAGELVTHAQSCLWIVGASRLAEALNRGLDAHLAGAASIVGISYEEAVKRKKAGDKQIGNIRQAFKPCNFGFPGRMGGGKLVLQQRKGGPDTTAPDGTVYKGLRFCILMGVATRCGEVKVTEWKRRPYPPTCLKCLECATQLREQWLKQWPENAAYFDFVKRIDESGQPVVQHVSKRLRGFKQGQVDEQGEPINSGNAIANGYFQALLADAAKNALMAITRECFDNTHVVRSFTKHISRWDGGPSPLLGSRVILFAHDETVNEHPEPVAHEAATRASEIMEETLRVACPDMDPAVEALPTLMRRLYKASEPVYVDGRLVPWEPKRKAAA